MDTPAEEPSVAATTAGDEAKKPVEQVVTTDAVAGTSRTGGDVDESRKRKAEDDTEDGGGEGAGETVTMLDVLQDEAELEEDAKAVLGGADEKNCTYAAQGYAKRQPLYSCLTCVPPPSTDDGAKNSCGGGVCLACSYHCHEGHDLVELYTKRRFRCDCGNANFPNKNPCCLDSHKAERNDKNRYNQNFSGLYCVCRRPYPDPEDPVSDEMIQCVVCEDWFHGRHLVRAGEGKQTPRGEEYSEMVCQGCVGKHRFLAAYRHLDCGHDQEAVKIEVEAVDSPKAEKPCLLASQKVKKEEEENDKPTALFLVSGWRDQLCRCQQCRQRYDGAGLDFLLDPEDTVHHYEANSKKSSSDKSQYEEGMQALSEMERTQQVEAIQSYNQMKGDLMDYLRSFASGGKVVKQEDIASFFQKMKERKRRRVEIPKFCR